MPRQEDDEQHEQDAVGLTERLVLAMKAGMNLDSLLTALKDGAAGSKAMDQKGEKMIKAEYTPESRLTTSLMDVRLMLEQGQRFGTPMFLTSIYAHICPDRDPDGPGRARSFSPHRSPVRDVWPSSTQEPRRGSAVDQNGEP